MSKYHSIINKIQTNSSTQLTLDAQEQALIEEALITLQFLEIVFKKRLQI